MAATLGDNRPFAVISGLTFAKELGLGMPTAVTVGARDADFAEVIAYGLALGANTRAALITRGSAN